MTGPHLSSLELHARALGTLSAGRAAAADAHVAGCDLCRRRVGDMGVERERFEREVFARTLPEVERRAHRLRWSWAWVAAPGLAVGLAGILLFLRAPQVAPDASAGFSVKGGPRLQVFAKRGDSVFDVHEGDALAPGDRLRFAVEPGRFGQLLIVSVDGAGHRSVYFPFNGTQSASLVPETRNELPGSVTLDPTPGEETLTAVFSDAPLPAARVLETLDSGETRPGAQPNTARLTLRFRKANR